MFVVIEGPDGVGKTTLSKKLVKRLKKAGIKAHRTHEPFLPLKSVMEVLPDMSIEEMYKLFIIDRAVHVKRVISKYADSKEHVLICDRYWPSTFVYQGLLGIDEERILKDNMTFPQPAIVFILRAPVEELAKRIAKRGGKDVLEAKTSVEKVVERYNKVARILKEMEIRVVYVDNQDDIDQTVEEVYAQIMKLL